MPLLQEPVWDTEGVFLPEPPLSDSSDMSEGFRRLHLDPGSILTPLSDPPSGLFTSSPDQAWCTAVEAECFSASVTGWKHTHTHSMSDLLLLKKASFKKRCQVLLKSTPFYDGSHRAVLSCQHPQQHHLSSLLSFNSTNNKSCKSSKFKKMNIFSLCLCMETITMTFSFQNCVVTGFGRFSRQNEK